MLTTFFLMLGSFTSATDACTPEPDNSFATLVLMTDEETKGALVGGFTTLEGERLKGIPRNLLVVPGKKTIGYMCHILLDGPKTEITRDFKAGRTYEFYCRAGSEEARIVEK